MKRILLPLALSLISTVVLAQDQTPASVVVSIGSGINNSPSALKNENYIGNGYQANASVFMPFYRKGWDGTVKGGSFTLGILTGLEYQNTKSLSPSAEALKSKYGIFNGELKPTSIERNKTKQFSGALGLQADLNFGKITLSPSLSAAYFNLKAPAYAQSASVSVNGTTQTLGLNSIAETKKNGLLIKPQFRLSYALSKNLNVYTAASMNFGPTISSTQTELVPLGGFNNRNTYEVKQLTDGSQLSKTQSNTYRSTQLNLGLSWAFGSQRKGKLRGKVTKPGDGGMSAISLVGTLTANGGGAAAAAYAATGRVVAPGVDPDPKKADSAAVAAKSKTDGLTNRLSMNVTVARQTQGKNFGEKVSSGLLSGAGMLQQGASKVKPHVRKAKQVKKPGVKKTAKTKKVEKATSGLKDTLKTQV